MYPLEDPFDQGWLPVGDGHAIYYEQCGRPDGLPVVFLHGGPGSGASGEHRRFFDPSRWRAVLFDQRGAGRSRAQDPVAANTTDHLVADLEALRHHLEIPDWWVLGGSWGATLGLVYAQRHRPRVRGLILRGSFLARARDLNWFVGPDGVARIFPEAYRALMAALPPGGARHPMHALHDRLHGNDPDQALAAARAWYRWEATVGGWTLPAGPVNEPEPGVILDRARIMTHYARHRFFLPPAGALAQPDTLADVDGWVIHGRRDLVCPVEAAHTICSAWPRARLEVLENAGHLASEPPMAEALIRALAAVEA